MLVPEVRSIIHLDLDAFYASVEQLDDPALRGQAVIVVKDNLGNLVPGATVTGTFSGTAVCSSL